MVRIKLTTGKSGATHYAIFDNISMCWKSINAQKAAQLQTNPETEIIDMRQ